MNEEDKTSSPSDLYENIVDYFNARFRLMKIDFIEKSSKVGGSFLYGLILAFLLVTALLLVGFGLAEFISFKNGNSYSGFFWVGGSFLGLLITLFFFRNRILKSFQNPIIKSLSDLLLEEDIHIPFKDQ